MTRILQVSLAANLAILASSIIGALSNLLLLPFIHLGVWQVPLVAANLLVTATTGLWIWTYQRLAHAERTIETIHRDAGFTRGHHGLEPGDITREQAHRLVTAYDRAIACLRRLPVIDPLITVAVIINCLVLSASSFARGHTVGGILALVVAVLLAALFGYNNRGQRKRIKRLLGEKSRSLRDRLVQNQNQKHPGWAPA